MKLIAPVLGKHNVAAREQLCTAIEDNSTWIWNRLRETKTYDCSMYEESLTDFFVLKLIQRVRRGFQIKAFTRHEEGKTGSDWEWWFGGTAGTWLGMRVQAKIINLRTCEYDHLHYKKKNGTPQVDILMDDASKHRLIPIYCLYTYWDQVQQKELWRSYGSRVQYRTPYGAAVLSAAEVKARNGMKKLTEWIPYMSPLSSLFCVGRQSSVSFPHAILANVGALNLLGGQESRNTEQFVRRQAPIYVYELLESRRRAELQSLDDVNVGRVTVIQESAAPE